MTSVYGSGKQHAEKWENNEKSEKHMRKSGNMDIYSRFYYKVTTENYSEKGLIYSLLKKQKFTCFKLLLHIFTQCINYEVQWNKEISFTIYGFSMFLGNCLFHHYILYHKEATP